MTSQFPNKALIQDPKANIKITRKLPWHVTNVLRRMGSYIIYMTKPPTLLTKPLMPPTSIKIGA